jgi:Zn-dependent protease with chaperone function
MLYTGLAFYVARQNELEADRYALDVADDEELARLFSQLIVTRNFLNSKFWPKLIQLARRGDTEHRPYASLTRVLQRGLKREEMQSWIKTAFDTVSDHHHFAPLLRQRLENIGHDRPASPRPLQETAADHYLGTPVTQKIIGKFDQRWLAKSKNQSHASG